MTELLRPSPEDELAIFQKALKENVDRGLMTQTEANEAERLFRIGQLDELDLDFDDLINGIGAM